MGKEASIKRNIVMNAILSMSAFIFPLITFPYISRVLGPEGTGKVSLATSWVTYFNMIAQLGIPTYGIRACAQVREDKTLLSRTVHELLFINALLSVIAYVAFFTLIAFYPKIREERLLYTIVSSTILLNALGMEWLFKGLEQYEYITKRSILFKTIAVILMFLSIRTKSDYVLYGAISVIASSASNIVNFIYARKFIFFKPIGGYQLMRHMKAVGVFFAMTCATVIYTNLDVVMLGYLTTDVDVGYYNAAVRIKVILVSIVTSLGNALLPRASYYVEHKKMDDFNRITRKALRFVLVIATPLMLYFILYASFGIFFIAGKQYSGSILPMQIIMPTLVFIGLTNIMGIQVLIPLGKERIVLYSEITGALVDAVLNLMLIPVYKSTGAAIGTVVAELAVFIYQYFALKDELAGVFKEFQYRHQILALVGAVIASYWASLIQWSKVFVLEQFIVLLITSLCFSGAYLAILLFFKEPVIIEIKESILQRLSAR